MLRRTSPGFGSCQEVLDKSLPNISGLIFMVAMVLLQALYRRHDLFGIRHGGDIVLLHETHDPLFVDDHDGARRNAAFRQVEAVLLRHRPLGMEIGQQGELDPTCFAKALCAQTLSTLIPNTCAFKFWNSDRSSRKH